MGTNRRVMVGLPMGELPVVVEKVSAGPVVADTFAGRIHMEWDGGAPVTPLGQLPFFIEYLKQGGLFDGVVADCPLHYTSPNAPRKRDVLGTVLLSVLAGHWRYAHMTTLRCDPVNPPLLGMTQVVSEDAVRRGFDKIEEGAGLTWLQGHLDYTTRPLLSEPWILDADSEALRTGFRRKPDSVPMIADSRCERAERRSRRRSNCVIRDPATER